MSGYRFYVTTTTATATTTTTTAVASHQSTSVSVAPSSAASSSAPQSPESSLSPSSALPANVAWGTASAEPSSRPPGFDLTRSNPQPLASYTSTSSTTSAAPPGFPSRSTVSSSIPRLRPPGTAAVADAWGDPLGTSRAAPMVRVPNVSPSSDALPRKPPTVASTPVPASSAASAAATSTAATPQTPSSVAPAAPSAPAVESKESVESAYRLLADILARLGETLGMRAPTKGAETSVRRDESRFGFARVGGAGGSSGAPPGFSAQVVTQWSSSRGSTVAPSLPPGF
eukprot:CAMPEP_0198368390 /NCGR_PEP_ID=MMETSP1450-20131203/155676_1 /TAXON_ID=753684 ORGANISM="Madagascaria erythrocladiodes, Strain CCMP3234" /NCGR_SAMPLE_ID=MMETSP1450 /ASSEMBLY_ACC=CAM_ASM_001115 /LENGTH=285 /DNA_ID=CAMNT_0044075895 /DNA_START=898 /DNA_END=1755 /DNA_ORIENTATION=-